MRFQAISFLALKPFAGGFFLIASTLLGGIPGLAQQAQWQTIDSMLTGWDKNTPGLSVAIIRNGHTVFSRSSGMANIARKIPNKTDSPFWIASVTKQFTAAAIFLLEREGKIHLNNSVRQYLTELPSVYQKVQVADLLYHTSGIRDGFVLTALARKSDTSYTNRNVLWYLNQQQGLNFEPGSRFEYNNSGYVLLATIIERISGESFPVFVKHKLLNPLGLSHSFVSGTFPGNTVTTEGYYKTAGTFEPHHFRGGSYGSTGMVTTLEDMTTWAQLLQRPDNIAWFASIVKKLLQPGRTRDGHWVAYAGGLEKLRYKGQTVYEHFGADEGFKADIVYFPDQELTIIGLTNNESYYGLGKLLFDIFRVLQGETHLLAQTYSGDQPATTPTFFYNSHLPKLIVVQNKGRDATIGTTVTGNGTKYFRSNDTLTSGAPTDYSYVFEYDGITLLDPYNQDTVKLSPLKPVSSEIDLNNYIGQYYSAEIATGFTIRRTEKGIAFEFLSGVEFELFRLTDTDFIFEYQGPNFIQFDDKGFYFSREGCRMLAFNKTQP